MNNLLEIKNLTKCYEGFTLDNISISVPAGAVVGFIGANGAGKTTTIKAALGLIPYTSGSISLFDNNIGDRTSLEAAQAKQRLGVVLDTCSFPDSITIAEAGKTLSYAYEKWDANQFAAYLDLFELNPGKTVKGLSHGMGMKLTLACALSHEAELLLLDEATAGLDPLARDEVIDLLREFMSEENRGILISSHITSDLEKIADYIVCIDKGKIIFQCEKDLITDRMGVAHCTESDFQKILNSGYLAPHEVHHIRNAYEISILVPDRFDFSQQFSDIAVDKVNIDEYMRFMSKGATQ